MRGDGMGWWLNGREKITEDWAQSTGHKNGLFVRRSQSFEEYDFT